MCKIDKYLFQGDVVYYEYDYDSSKEDTAPAIAPGPTSAPAPTPAPTGQLSTKITLTANEI